MDTINRVFQISMPTDPKHCLLNILEIFEWEESTRTAVTRTLLLARKMIMLHWISEDPPTVKEWISAVGNMIRMEKMVYQHRGCSRKFEKFWGPWLDVPGLVPVDLVMGRLLGLNAG